MSSLTPRQRVRRSCARVEALEERNLLSFAGPLNYSVALAPTAVMAADFNSDGYADVLAGVGLFGTADSVALFPSNGDGTLADPVVYTLSRPASLVATGDFDGNAVPDALTSGQGGLAVLFGNGDGTFRESAPVLVPAPGAVADLDGDGLDDLAVSNGVYLGNGDGTFRLVESISMRGATNQLAAADFDQDGDRDLAIVVNFIAPPQPPSQPGVYVLLNNGDATFTPGGYYRVSFRDATFLGFGDLDGDQVGDLFVLQYTAADLYVFRGNGDGTFQSPAGPSARIQGIRARPGDFNNDGILDLATVSGGYGQVNVYLNNGDGSFAASRVLAGFSPAALDAADLDGDGALDLVVGNSGSKDVSVRRGFGDGTFDTGLNLTVGNNPTAVNTGDVNGDGLPDLVSANSSSANVGVLLNAGDGTFKPGRTYATAAYPFDVQLADFNGDGALDLVTVNASGDSVSILLNNGDGTFQARRNYAVGVAPNSVAVGDFTGDGRLDLAVTNRGPDTVSLLRGIGDGTFAPAVSFAAGANPTGIAAGDFNGDGALDLAIANLGHSRVTLLFGNGDGTFQGPQAVPVGFRPGVIRVADFNFDGLLDLAVADDGPQGAPGSVWVLLGNGDGTFLDPLGYGQGSISLALNVADFDLDGVPDLVVGVGSGVKVLFGNGDGSFREATRSHGASSFVSDVASADFNGDGYPDLVFPRAFIANTLGILFNEGGRPPGSPPGAGGPAGGQPFSFLADQVVIDALWPTAASRRPAVSTPR